MTKDLDRPLAKDAQIENKHVRRSSAPCVIRKCQIKTIMGARTTATRMAHRQQWAKHRQHRTLGSGWGSRSSLPLLLGVQQGPATLEDRRAVSHKIKHNFTIWPSDRASGLFTRMCWKHVHAKGFSTQIFTAALLIIAQTWKQPRCPSGGEWINKP